MQDCPNKQSALRRAINDTISAQKSVRFMCGGEGVLAVAGGAWLTACVPIDASIIEIVIRSVIGGLIGLVVAIILIFIFNWLLAPYRICKDEKDELNTKLCSVKQRTQILEDERIPRIEVKTFCGKRSFDYENKHLMWAELRISNTSSSLPLKDVQVRIISVLEIISYIEGKEKVEKRDLYERGNFSPVGISWSERDTYPPSVITEIPPSSMKAALVAFQDNSNGGDGILNSPVAPKPIIVGGQE